jgi:DNA polymerase I-like protein with 3'-5' exonuclease and polymerase domains
MIYYITNQTTLEKSFPTITIPEIIQYINDRKIIAVDTETTGFDFLTKKIVMLQLGDGDNQFVIDAKTVNILLFKDILEDTSIVKVFQNIKFDYKFFKHIGINIVNVYDTMLAEQVLLCGKKDNSASLDVLCKRYLNVEMSKIVRKTFSEKICEFTNSQILYGAKDVEHLIAIKNLQSINIAKYGLEIVVNLENEAALGFAEMEYNGMEFDAEKWLSNTHITENEVAKLTKELDAHVLQNPILAKYVIPCFQGDFFMTYDETKENARRVSILWSSPAQVLKVFKLLGLAITDVDGKELYKYKHLPIINSYLNYKGACKVVSTYGKAFVKNVDIDGKMRTSFYQILETGRVSSGNKKQGKVNMQNIPSDNRFRTCFSASKGNVLVSCDYSGQELRLIAAGSKDPVWLDVISRGQDIHSVCAELVYGPKWYAAKEKDCAYYSIINPFGDIAKQKCNCKEHKKLRNSVKTINFGLAYGMSKYKLSNTLQITVEEADELINTYFSVFPSIKNFLTILGKFGTDNGYIRTFAPYRRLRWFDDWDPKMRNSYISDKEISRNKGSIERQSKNSPIQGGGADQIKQAIAYIMKYKSRVPYPVKLVLQVHDDIICEVPEENGIEWGTIQRRLMRVAGMHNVKILPMEGEVSISKEWRKD